LCVDLAAGGRRGKTKQGKAKKKEVCVSASSRQQENRKPNRKTSSSLTLIVLRRVRDLAIADMFTIRIILSGSASSSSSSPRRCAGRAWRDFGDCRRGDSLRGDSLRGDSRRGDRDDLRAPDDWDRGRSDRDCSDRDRWDCCLGRDDVADVVELPRAWVTPSPIAAANVEKNPPSPRPDRGESAPRSVSTGSA
jgi:hypothetical protein